MSPFIMPSLIAFAMSVKNSSLPSVNIPLSVFLTTAFTLSGFAALNAFNCSKLTLSKTASAIPAAIPVLIACPTSPPFSITSFAADTPADVLSIVIPTA